jgi:NIMA (never in mitosis gene a)-related kinase
LACWNAFFLQDFIIKEKIGSGSYGVVFKVVRKVDRVTYAMKEIDLAGMSRKEQEECIRETRVLSQLDSDYIIKYYDSFLERVCVHAAGLV